MQQFIARAFFNLGWMRHFGTGLAQDFILASKFYAKSEEANPGGVQVPIRIMQAFLYVHSYYNDLPMWETVGRILAKDKRSRLLFAHTLVFVVVLIRRLASVIAFMGVDVEVGVHSILLLLT